MKPGDRVMIPRTGGGYSLGEILEIFKDPAYGDRARVIFPTGMTLSGQFYAGGKMGYKTVKLCDLMPVEEESI